SAAASSKPCSAPPAPSASRASLRAGSPSARQAADVVAEAVDHQERQQHDADGAEAVHGGERDAPPTDLLGQRPEYVPTVEGQEREQVDDRQHERDEPE